MCRKNTKVYLVQNGGKIPSISSSLVMSCTAVSVREVMVVSIRMQYVGVINVFPVLLGHSMRQITY